MPYTPPGTLTAADRNLSSERNHHRSRSFTDEKGPGAFAPLAGVPRRNARPGVPKLTMPGPPSTATTSTSVATPPPVVKSPKFELHAGSSEDSDEDDDDERIQNPLASKIISHGTSSPTVHGHAAPLSRPVPFPSVHSPTGQIVITAASPIPRSVSSPQIASPSVEQSPSPSIYRSPYSSLRSEPSTRDRFPLKPALKSNYSSPHLPSLAHGRSLTQSAPSTPNLPKTAWLTSSTTSNNGGSAPGSPGSTYSIPPTPKSVHFASEKEALESVVVFSKGARPRSLSNPGGYDTETETEGYDSTAGSGARYPFPVMPKNEVVPMLDEAASSEVPMKRALGSNGFGVGDERQFVYLETVMLPGSRPPTLRGSVLVRNVAFQKRVAVRFTLDDWQTISEVSCTYSASLPNIPPPFSSSSSPFTPTHSRSATVTGLPTSGSSSSLNLSNGKADAWDRFTFTIKLEDVERTLPNKRMFLVVRYQVPSQWGWESGAEWWDNNNAKNYEFGFKMGKKATANSSNAVEEGGPSALVARTSASVNRGHDTSPVMRTQSLPPLPPPGPVRSAPSPLNISPNNSVLGLGGLGKAKPVLASISASGPKLRAGRGPTFTDLPSPRGSPPGSPVARNSPTRAATSYTPPLPGSVPGITHGITSPNLAGLERPAAPSPPAPKPAEPTPAPAPSAATPAPVSQAPKPQGLTISTVNLSPTGTVGKKRGLSLSNYVSPTMVKSPSSMSINNANSMQNLSSLMGSGGDGGENAYAHAKPTLPYVYTPPSSIGRKDSQNGPLTPGSLKLVGGMPATIIDENGSAPVERVPSWDIPLNGLWNALAQQKPTDLHQKKASDSEDSSSSSSEEQIPLPTPPESSGDSTLSTPDLERSPEAESVSFDDVKRKETDPGRDTPTPTLVSTAGPAETGLSTVPFPRSSPTDSPRSSDGDNTVRHVSPELPTPQSSDAEGKPPTLSNLGRRTSLQTGQTMRLELPQRPRFDIPPAEELSPPKPVRKASPSASSSSSSGSDNGSPTKSGLTMKSGKSKKRKNQPETTPVPQFGLGLNMSASPASANGPPPEFLAKYCFFVSSPGVSPPTSTSPANSSAVTSPSAGSVFGTGVDTPRASSPGLASAATWWGYSAVPERA